MKRTLFSGLLSAGILSACAAAPTGDSGASPQAASPGIDPSVAAAAKAFGQCKADAATRNLSLAAHQEALVECARQHAGKRGEACITELILNKARVSALENGMAQCLQISPKS